MLGQCYKKINIEYNESKDNWSCDSEGVTEEASSLKEIKEKIDKALKKDFKRIPIWWKSYWSSNAEYSHGEITSFIREEKYSIQEAWVMSDKGHRSKESINQLIEDTEDNRSRIGSIKSFNEKIEKLEQERKNINEGFVMVSARFSKEKEKWVK